MTLWSLLALASGALGILWLWRFWMTWRSERIRLEALFILNATRKIHTSEDIQKEFPAMAKYAAEAVPWIQRSLIETVAKKHSKTPEALEKALLADTGARSLDEALRTPMGSSTVFDMLWADSESTDDRLQLGVRNWFQRSGLSIHRIHKMEKVLLALTIVSTAAAVMFLALTLKHRFL
jgi:hypothetical protein